MIPYLSEAPARGSLSMSPGSDGCAQVWSLTPFFQLAVCKTSKTMVLQTTTRGVGRVQKIQNGTILEQIEKNSEKTSLVSKYSK